MRGGAPLYGRHAIGLVVVAAAAALSAAWLAAAGSGGGGAAERAASGAASYGTAEAVSTGRGAVPELAAPEYLAATAAAPEAAPEAAPGTEGAAPEATAATTATATLLVRLLDADGAPLAPIAEGRSTLAVVTLSRGPPTPAGWSVRTLFGPSWTARVEMPATLVGPALAHVHVPSVPSPARLSLGPGAGADPLAVTTAAGEMLEVELRLRPGGSLTVRVVDEAGAPFAGARVSITSPRTPANEPRTADARGEVRLGPERVGHTHVWLTVDDPATGAETTGDAYVVEGAEVLVVVLPRLPEPGRAVLRALDAEGRPVEPPPLCVRWAGDLGDLGVRAARQIRHGGPGAHRVGPEGEILLHPGRYEVRATTGERETLLGAIDVPAGGRVERAFTLPRLGALELTLDVHLPEGLLSHAWVFLERDMDAVIACDAGRGPHALGIAGEDALLLIVSGERLARLPFSVAPGETRRVTLALPPLATVEVRAADARGDPVLDAPAVTLRTLGALASSRRASFGGVSPDGAAREEDPEVPDDVARFLLVPAGPVVAEVQGFTARGDARAGETCALTVRIPLEGEALERAHGYGDSDAAARTIEAEREAASDRYRSRGLGRLRLRVVDEAGTPLSGAVVVRPLASPGEEPPRDPALVRAIGVGPSPTEDEERRSRPAATRCARAPSGGPRETPSPSPCARARPPRRRSSRGRPRRRRSLGGVGTGRGRSGRREAPPLR